MGLGTNASQERLGSGKEMPVDMRGDPVWLRLILSFTSLKLESLVGYWPLTLNVGHSSAKANLP